MDKVTFTVTFRDLRALHVSSTSRFGRVVGNPCPDFEKPFPCKSTSTCLPMGYVCDSIQVSTKVYPRMMRYTWKYLRHVYAFE